MWSEIDVSDWLISQTFKCVCKGTLQIYVICHGNKKHLVIVVFRRTWSQVSHADNFYIDVELLIAVWALH